MTTVINLNILNLFSQQVNKKSANNNQDRHSAERRMSLPVQKTIDVTPSTPVVSCNQPESARPREIPVMSSGQPEILDCHPRKIQTYDLKAYSANYFKPKGTHIDSFV